MENKELVRFNIKNAKYAVKTSGTYGSFVSFGTSKKFAASIDSATKDIYGDGRRVLGLVNERKKTMELTLNTLCEAYEIAMGRKLQTAQGLAEIKQVINVEHVIYFETEAVDEDGKKYTAKTMVYGVISPKRPEEEYNQNTDDINESEFVYSLEGSGVPLQTAGGTDYVDANGNTVMVWQMTLTPSDSGYESFGNTVVMPSMPA